MKRKKKENIHSKLKMLFLINNNQINNSINNK